MRYKNIRSFLSDLKSGTIRQDILLCGLVKPASEPECEDILFTLGRSCENQWISIPQNLIESIEPLGNVTCRDHTHEFIRMKITPPTRKDREAFALVALLQAVSAESRLRAPRRFAPRARTSIARMRSDAFLCESLEGEISLAEDELQRMVREGASEDLIDLQWDFMQRLMQMYEDGGC
jgi:hypothetical protein